MKKLIVDLHTHLYEKPDYAAMLAETAHNLGFKKLCIGGGEPRYGLASNETVIEVAGAYPDLFVPFAFIRPGEVGPADVESLHRDGFIGIKAGAPSVPFDSDEFMPALRAAEVLSLPVMFHTGIFPVTDLDRAEKFRPDLARPIHLDVIARELPRLNIIGTGLGAPWFEEAAALLEVHENIFFDLSKLHLRERGAHFFKCLLGVESDSKWGDSRQSSRWEQIVFGTASENRDIPFVERDYQRLFRALALPEKIISGVMGENALTCISHKATT